MDGLSDGALLVFGDVGANRLSRALHRLGGHLQTGQNLHLLASLLERRRLAHQRVHTPHTGRELGVLNIQLDVCGELPGMAVRAEIVRAGHFGPAHCREDRDVFNHRPERDPDVIDSRQGLERFLILAVWKAKFRISGDKSFENSIETVHRSLQGEAIAFGAASAAALPWSFFGLAFVARRPDSPPWRRPFARTLSRPTMMRLTTFSAKSTRKSATNSPGVFVSRAFVTSVKHFHWKNFPARSDFPGALERPTTE